MSVIQDFPVSHQKLAYIFFYVLNLSRLGKKIMLDLLNELRNFAFYSMLENYLIGEEGSLFLEVTLKLVTKII